jgi:CRISPR/Cas system-associated protein Cas10 (large subunit of type III CRISPR-Cas system)
MNQKCRLCGSEQFTLDSTSIGQEQGKLCDVCYWRQRAFSAERRIMNSSNFIDHMRAFRKQLK